MARNRTRTAAKGNGKAGGKTAARRGTGGRKGSQKAAGKPNGRAEPETAAAPVTPSGVSLPPARQAGRTGRATEFEALERRLAVKKMLLEGHQRFDIVQYGAERWGLRTRQMDYYLAAARAEIKAQLDAAGLVSLEWHIAARMHLYNKTIRIHDHATALRVVDSIYKLQPPGAAAPQVLFEEDHAELGTPRAPDAAQAERERMPADPTRPPEPADPADGDDADAVLGDTPPQRPPPASAPASAEPAAAPAPQPVNDPLAPGWRAPRL